MKHTPAEYATFTDAEPRMVWAARRDGGAPFHLEDGMADELREFTKTELRCLVPTCGTPDLTTVARRVHRQGFRHLVDGGGCAPESALHHQGKAVLADWLTTHAPAGSTVHLERPSNKERERIPDVTLILPNGRQVAFEIQYAALSNWQERHDWYVTHGIDDVWLFGHTGHHMKVTGSGNVTLNQVHRDVLAAGSPVLWFNPLEQAVGVAGEHQWQSGVLTPPTPTTGRARLLLFPLDECTVDDTGLRSPTLDELANGHLKHADVMELKAREQEILAQEEAERRKAIGSWLEQLREVASGRDLYFQHSATHRRIEELFPGKWPRWLNVEPRGRGFRKPVIDLPYTPRQWQATLYLGHIHGKPDRTPVTIHQFAKLLSGMDKDVRYEWDCVKTWFTQMVADGILELTVTHNVHGRDEYDYVTRDPEAVAQEKYEARVRRRAEWADAHPDDPTGEKHREQERLAAAAESVNSARRNGSAQAQQAAERRLPTTAELAATGHQIPALPEPLRGQPRCVNCYGTLHDGDDTDRGYHSGCFNGLMQKTVRP